jgi:beta-galactosidase/beta-glucuronidase
MAVVAEPVESHPNPRLRRPGWVDLRGPWAFAIDDDNVGLARGWGRGDDAFGREICVPFPPESRLSGIAEPGPHPVVWYRRTIHVEPPDPGRRVFVHFGAVDYASDVWVNGVPVGAHRGGNSSFSLDITDALAAGGDQVLQVRAEDSSTDLTQPRGKQSWEPEPSRIWYGRTTGIWQPVWVETVPATHIVDVDWTPRPGSRVDVAIRLSREPASGDRIWVRLTRAGTLVIEDLYRLSDPELERRIQLEPAVLEIGRPRLLWSPDHPNLIDAVVTLEDHTGRILDEVHSYFGLRTVDIDDDLFTLNGQPLYLRLVLSQGYWPESHLAAPSDDALRREVEWVKRLGFNGVRIHQKVEDPRFLYWCDRLGVLVWSEMASNYLFTRVGVDRLVREWLDVVQRDRNHPSIVTWVPFNESWGVPELATDEAQQSFVRSVYHLTKALDPTRPVIGNDGWEHLVGDMVGVHDYAVDGDILRERYGTRQALDDTLASCRPQDHRLTLGDAVPGPKPVVLSEFGGIAYDPQPGKPWFGYGTVGDAAGFLELYEDLVGAVLDSGALAGFCYTQLTDTAQEANGLLTAERQPKVDVEQVARITSRPSRATPGQVTTLAHAAAEAVVRGEAL